MGRTYDLVERTAVFGESIIDLASRVPQNPITKPLISLLVRSGTSVGANMAEADESGSTKEFTYRLSLCCRELRETQHWLRMIVKAEGCLTDDAQACRSESDELTRIIATIRRRSLSVKENGEAYRINDKNTASMTTSPFLGIGH